MDHGADRISKNVYDSAGRLIETWDGVGTLLERREAAWTYNANGQKLSLVDARSYRAEMTYDGFGRQSRWIFPSKSTPGIADPADYEQYRYDPNGNRVQLRKRDGQTLGFEHDALNRVAVKYVPGPVGNVRYGYDLRGLQTAAFFTATSQGVFNAYDGFGRLTSTTLNMGGFSRTVSHQYDREGRRTELTFPDSQKFWTRRDGLGRATDVVQGPLGSTSTFMAGFAYNSAAQRSYFSRRFGDATSYAYDLAGRASMIEDVFGLGTGNTRSDFLYNPASQLVSETRSNDNYAWRGAVPVTRDYATNGLNQYTGTANGGLPGATFGYDANGNLTSTVNPPWSTSYAYDAENRLVSATGTENATLVYDPLGRLFQISSPTTGTTQFLYDGDELVAEYNGSGTLLRRYVHGDSDDDPLFWYEGAGLDQPRFPHTDRQGSITGTAGPGALLLGINTYDEYGIPGANNGGRFQYTGQAWLTELGLYYYKARFYSPTLGRFLQTDPIGYEDQINLYAYIGNDPVNGSDPNGTCGNRYEDGSCQVKVDPKTGAAGLEAGRALEARLNHYDAAVNGLDPKSIIPVTNDAGRTIGSMTGRQLQKAWNNQRFSIISKKFNNGGLGKTIPGRTRLNPSAVSRYTEGAVHKGGTPEMGRDTLIFHEFGHALDPGRGVAIRNRERPGQPNPKSENAANAQGRAISNSVGGSFMCELPGPYGC